MLQDRPSSRALSQDGMAQLDTRHFGLGVGYNLDRLEKATPANIADIPVLLQLQETLVKLGPAFGRLAEDIVMLHDFQYLASYRDGQEVIVVRGELKQARLFASPFDFRSRGDGNHGKAAS